jgi:hypothetical protein
VLGVTNPEFRHVAQEAWTPTNYDGRPTGPRTLRYGIEHSKNLMTVRLAKDLGMPLVAEYELGYDVVPEGRTFPVALEPFLCNRFEIAAFTRVASELGVSYLGLCCGGAPHYVRAMAAALGRSPEASRYSPDMSRHFAFGTDARLKAHIRAQASLL